MHPSWAVPADFYLAPNPLTHLVERHAAKIYINRNKNTIFFVPPLAIKRELRETIACLSIHYFPPVDGDLWLSS
jgi:hypothetical protein